MREFRIQNSESRIASPGAGRAAFTLIELLVAMAILVVITLIVARIFQQASVAWSTGTRKAEKYMAGRAVVDFLAQQLSRAVPDTNGVPFNVTGSPLNFFILDDASSGAGAIREVSYESSQLAEGISGIAVDTYGAVGSGLPHYGIVTVTMSDGTVFQSGCYFFNRDRTRL